MFDFLPILFSVYVIYALFAFFAFGKKIFSPSFIFSCSICLSLLFALIYSKSMKFSCNEKTFVIFTIAGFLFLAVEFISKIFLANDPKYKNGAPYRTIPKNKQKILYINNWVIITFLILALAYAVLAFISVRQSVSGGSLGDMMQKYKEMLLYSPSEIKYRFFISQIHKIVMSFSYICIFVFIYNWKVCGERFISIFRYLPIVVFFFVGSLLSQGARQPIVELVGFIAFIYFYFLWKTKKGKRVFLYIVLLIPAGIAAVYLFANTAALVGRTNVIKDPFRYFTEYYSGGFYYFNKHVEEYAFTEYFGQSSFSDIYSTLHSLGFIDESAVLAYHEFDKYGNTVTIFGRWYEDFGQAGVYIMTIIVSLFYSVLYYKNVFQKANPIGNHWHEIIYFKLLISIVWAGYDDRIRALISLNNILTILFMFILFKLFVRQETKTKKMFVKKVTKKIVVKQVSASELV